MQINLRKFSVITFISLMLLLSTVLSSCGSSNPIPDQQAGSVQTAQSETSGASDVQSASETTTAETTLSVDPAASADSLIGTWKDVNDDTQFAKITKTDSGFQLEQIDGTYPATFANGVLKVKATDTDTADAYIDKTTGHLIISYQGGNTEYIK